MNYSIQEPRSEDIELINQFFEIVILDTFTRNDLLHLEEEIKVEISDKRKFLKEYFVSKGRDRFFLIVKEDLKVIGTIEIGVSNSIINECTQDKLRDTIEVGTVYVHPDYQNKKIGRLMFYHIMLELQKRNVCEYCFDCGYKSAQRVWRHIFGQATFIINDYWGPNSHHMIWKLGVSETINLFRIEVSNM